MLELLAVHLERTGVSVTRGDVRCTLTLARGAAIGSRLSWQVGLSDGKARRLEGKRIGVGGEGEKPWGGYNDESFRNLLCRFTNGLSR
jgi:hypothetical protein